MIAFFRSMKFGLILMLLICICSLIGSVIPQGYETIYYEQNFGEYGKFITGLKLNDIFASIYFIGLLFLLCVNLILCSILRFKTIKNSYKNAFITASNMAFPSDSLEINDKEKIINELNKRHFAIHHEGNREIYYKNRFGHYGSFFVHLSILLIIIFSALIMYTAKAYDYNVVPGEQTNIYDGSYLSVESFRIANDNGKTDYVSTICVMDNDGVTSDKAEIRVNKPFSFDGKKYFQNSYGTAGSLVIKNRSTLFEDKFILTDSNQFIVSDSQVLTYLGIDTTQKEVFYKVAIKDSDSSYMLAVKPNDTLALGDIDFTFKDIEYYSGIKVKKDLPIAMAGLYSSFIIMIVGLWLCFFSPPVYIVLCEEEVFIISKNKLNYIDIFVNSY